MHNVWNWSSLIFDRIHGMHIDYKCPVRYLYLNFGMRPFRASCQSMREELRVDSSFFTMVHRSLSPAASTRSAQVWRGVTNFASMYSTPYYTCRYLVPAAFVSQHYLNAGSRIKLSNLRHGLEHPFLFMPPHLTFSLKILAE